MFSNVSNNAGNNAPASARGEAFDSRTKTLKDDVKRGKVLQKQGNETAAVSAGFAAGTLLFVPLAALLPPAGVLAVPGVLGAAAAAEDAGKLKKKGRAMVQRAAYLLELRDLHKASGNDSDLLVRRLVGAGVVRPLPAGPNELSSRSYSVVPRTDIAEVLRTPPFAHLSGQQRADVTRCLQQIVEMGPILEVLQEAESKLHAAIAKGDAENAKIYSKQIVDLRALWACDGTASVQDPSIQTSEAERMLNYLRQELTNELQKGFSQDPLRVRRLRNDLRAWGETMTDLGNVEEDVADLIDL